MVDRSSWTVAVEDPRVEDVHALVRAHIEFSRSQTPPEFSFALDSDGLDEAGVALFGLRADGELLGMIALKDLGDGHGEIKSMHTAQRARGAGVARTLLEHLLAAADDRALHTLSLETGTQPAFAPARALYESVGFVVCRPFADYRESPYSVFMTRSRGSR